MWKLEKALKDRLIAYTEYKCIETENSEIDGHFTYHSWEGLNFRDVNQKSDKELQQSLLLKKALL